jgi:hypothetical protein
MRVRLAVHDLGPEAAGASLGEDGRSSACALREVSTQGRQ